MLDSIPDSEVKEALESIPEQFRMAVILADVEGFSYKEIAEILDVPIGTVMSRIHRGRRALQKSCGTTPSATTCGRAPRRRPGGDGDVDCDHAIHRVYEYLDGELTMWQRRAIARHLDDCPPCAQGFVFEIQMRQRRRVEVLRAGAR